MNKPFKKIFSPPTLRLKVAVIWEVVLILSLLLGVMLYFSRKTMQKESMLDAEVTLEGVVRRVDNVLLGVEQSSGNIYWDLVTHLDEPERMWTYCRRLVECNPDIMGCAIAFKPNYYPDRELFLAYVHRTKYDSPTIIEAETFARRPYTEEPWYKNTMLTKNVSWSDAHRDDPTEEATFITFCLPIRDNSGENVGVMAVDVSVGLLSHIVLSAKPTPNSYSLMLDRNGMFIVHPDRKVRIHETVFQHIEKAKDNRVHEAAQAMLAGETGNKLFHLNSGEWRIFYKPFVRYAVQGRATGDLNWSIGLVYPEDDIFGGYNHQLRHLLLNIILGLLAFYLLSKIVISMQFKPIRMLTESVQSIAEGNYSVTVPDTDRDDEIGLFQQHFKRLQRSLESYIGEKKKLSETLEEQRETLTKAHEKAKESARVKTHFLNSLAKQLSAPVEYIGRSVTHLCDDYRDMSRQELQKEADSVQQQCNATLILLNQILGKEAKHE